MSLRSEYDVLVRRRIPLMVALFGLLALPVFFVSSSSAQFGASSSAAASSGFAGHTATGTVPSAVVPVHPFTGTVPLANPIIPSGNSRVTFFGGNAGRPEHHHHHHPDGGFAVPYLYGYAVPYDFDYGDNGPETDANPQAQQEDEADYQGGPTVFDRRGSGEDSYIAPVTDVPTPHAAQADAAPASDDTPQEPTLLIFKDGQKLQVQNYAILGGTLFDLTPGHRRKIPLAELDLAATQQQNENQGVMFQLPQQAN